MKSDSLQTRKRQFQPARKQVPPHGFWRRTALNPLAPVLPRVSRLVRASDWDSLFPWLLLSIAINVSVWLPVFLWLPGTALPLQGQIDTSFLEIHVQKAARIPAASAATTSISLIPVRASRLEVPAQMRSVQQKQHPRHNERKSLEFRAWLRNWQLRIIKTASSHLSGASLPHGNIVIAVTVAPDGRLIRIAVLHGRSHPQLVTAALSIIRAAAPFPPLPRAWQSPPHPLQVVRTWNFGSPS